MLPSKLELPENKLCLACLAIPWKSSETLSLFDWTECTLCKLPFPRGSWPSNYPQQSFKITWTEVAITVGVNKKLTNKYKRKKARKWQIHQGIGKAPAYSWESRRPHTYRMVHVPRVKACSARMWEGRRISCSFSIPRLGKGKCESNGGAINFLPELEDRPQSTHAAPQHRIGGLSI